MMTPDKDLVAESCHHPAGSNTSLRFALDNAGPVGWPGLSHDIDLETAIAVGHPAEQIIHKAETEQVDLIILGRRGMSLFEKWLLGSVSERVLRYAHCPVMVVR